MVLDNVKQSTTDGSIDDVAYLTRSEHRISSLVALSNGPYSRSELCEVSGVSSSTIRRTLREFEQRSWIRKTGHQFEATQLGVFVASAMQDLIASMETERKLRTVWHWLPDDVGEFPIETWEDLCVTVAEPDSPYRPINRFDSLLRNTSRFRCVRPEIALMEPCFDLLFQLVEDGADVTLIDRPDSHEYFLSTYPERSARLMERDSFTVLEHESLPAHGVGLLDDRVAIGCFEQNSGTVQALIDADAPAVREWAESIFAAYRADARPLDSQRIDV